MSFEDFNLRGLVGDQPLYANLGICQVEQLILDKEWSKIKQRKRTEEETR